MPYSYALACVMPTPVIHGDLKSRDRPRSLTVLRNHDDWEEATVLNMKLPWVPNLNRNDDELSHMIPITSKKQDPYIIKFMSSTKSTEQNLQIASAQSIGEEASFHTTSASVSPSLLSRPQALPQISQWHTQRHRSVRSGWYWGYRASIAYLSPRLSVVSGGRNVLEWIAGSHRPIELWVFFRSIVLEE